LQLDQSLASKPMHSDLGFGAGQRAGVPTLRMAIISPIAFVTKPVGGVALPF